MKNLLSSLFPFPWFTWAALMYSSPATQVRNLTSNSLQVLEIANACFQADKTAALPSLQSHSAANRQ